MPGERLGLLVPLLVAMAVSTVDGRQPSAPQPPDRLAAAVTTAAGTAQRVAQSAELVYANRRIVTFRATVMSRPPELRARAATEQLQRLVDESPTSRPNILTYPEAAIIRLGDQPVFVIFMADIDPLENEDLIGTARAAAARPGMAVGESGELPHARPPARA